MTEKPRIKVDEWFIFSEYLAGKLEDGSYFVSTEIVRQETLKEVETKEAIYELGRHVYLVNNSGE